MSTWRALLAVTILTTCSPQGEQSIVVPIVTYESCAPDFLRLVLRNRKVLIAAKNQVYEVNDNERRIQRLTSDSCTKVLTVFSAGLICEEPSGLTLVKPNFTKVPLPRQFRATSNLLVDEGSNGRIVIYLDGLLTTKNVGDWETTKIGTPMITRTFPNLLPPGTKAEPRDPLAGGSFRHKLGAPDHIIANGNDVLFGWDNGEFGGYVGALTLETNSWRATTQLDLPLRHFARSTGRVWIVVGISHLSAARGKLLRLGEWEDPLRRFSWPFSASLVALDFDSAGSPVVLSDELGVLRHVAKDNWQTLDPDWSVESRMKDIVIQGDRVYVLGSHSLISLKLRGGDVRQYDLSAAQTTVCAR